MDTKAASTAPPGAIPASQRLIPEKERPGQEPAQRIPLFLESSGAGAAPRTGGNCSLMAPQSHPVGCVPPGVTRGSPGAATHQLDALREGVVLPVLLREALQDLSLPIPAPCGDKMGLEGSRYPPPSNLSAAVPQALVPGEAFFSSLDSLLTTWSFLPAHQTKKPKHLSSASFKGFKTSPSST